MDYESGDKSTYSPRWKIKTRRTNKKPTPAPTGARVVPTPPPFSHQPIPRPVTTTPLPVTKPNLDSPPYNSASTADWQRYKKYLRRGDAHEEEKKGKEGSGMAYDEEEMKQFPADEQVTTAAPLPPFNYTSTHKNTTPNPAAQVTSVTAKLYFTTPLPFTPPTPSTTPPPPPTTTYTTPPITSTTTPTTTTSAPTATRPPIRAPKKLEPSFKMDSRPSTTLSYANQPDNSTVLFYINRAHAGTATSDSLGIHWSENAMPAFSYEWLFVGFFVGVLCTLFTSCLCCLCRKSSCCGRRRRAPISRQQEDVAGIGDPSAFELMVGGIRDRAPVKKRRTIVQSRVWVAQLTHNYGRELLDRVYSALSDNERASVRAKLEDYKSRCGDDELSSFVEDYLGGDVPMRGVDAALSRFLFDRRDEERTEEILRSLVIAVYEAFLDTLVPANVIPVAEPEQ